jgi:hypothetical protein
MNKKDIKFLMLLLNHEYGGEIEMPDFLIVMDFMRRVDKNPQLLDDFRVAVENTIEEHDHTVEISHDNHHHHGLHHHTLGPQHQHQQQDGQQHGQEVGVDILEPSSPPVSLSSRLSVGDLKVETLDSNLPSTSASSFSQEPLKQSSGEVGALFTPRIPSGSTPVGSRRRSQYVSVDAFTSRNNKLQRELHAKDIARDNMMEEIKRIKAELKSTERRIQFLELSGGSMSLSPSSARLTSDASENGDKSSPALVGSSRSGRSMSTESGAWSTPPQRKRSLRKLGSQLFSNVNPNNWSSSSLDELVSKPNSTGQSVDSSQSRTRARVSGEGDGDDEGGVDDDRGRRFSPLFALRQFRNSKSKSFEKEKDALTARSSHMCDNNTKVEEYPLDQ